LRANSRTVLGAQGRLATLASQHYEIRKKQHRDASAIVRAQAAFSVIQRQRVTCGGLEVAPHVSKVVNGRWRPQVKSHSGVIFTTIEFIENDLSLYVTIMQPSTCRLISSSDLYCCWLHFC